MVRNGRIYELRTWVLRTSAKESGLWPTPTENGNHNQKGMSKKSGNGLSTAVKNFPTPSASMMTMADMEQARYAGNDPKRPTYQEAKEIFPTPGTFMIPSKRTKADRYKKKHGGPNLAESQGGSLNPAWVDWLMGYPVGWTDLKDSAIALYLK